MRRQSLAFLAAILGLAAAHAQDGDLSGVTMRVLDDVSDIDAVILELDANRGDDEEGAASAGADGANPAEQAAAEPAEAERGRVGERAREELHDAEVDERSEGKLEDNDVERAAVPPAP